MWLAVPARVFIQGCGSGPFFLFLFPSPSRIRFVHSSYIRPARLLTSISHFECGATRLLRFFRTRLSRRSCAPHLKMHL